MTPDEYGTGSQPPASSPTPEATEPVITHSEPLLSHGAAGPQVGRLVELLAACGHANNTVVSGDNPDRVFDNSVGEDVRRFCAEHGLEDTGIVGPEIWQALIDTAKAKVGEAA